MRRAHPQPPQPSTIFSQEIVREPLKASMDRVRRETRGGGGWGMGMWARSGGRLRRGWISGRREGGFRPTSCTLHPTPLCQPYTLHPPDNFALHPHAVP